MRREYTSTEEALRIADVADENAEWFRLGDDGAAEDRARRTAECIRSLVAERDAYEKTLRGMLTPPFILSSDDACEVAGWFVHEARFVLERRALTSAETTP